MEKTGKIRNILHAVMRYENKLHRQNLRIGNWDEPQKLGFYKTSHEDNRDIFFRDKCWLLHMIYCPLYLKRIQNVTYIFIYKNNNSRVLVCVIYLLNKCIRYQIVDLVESGSWKLYVFYTERLTNFRWLFLVHLFCSVDIESKSHRRYHLKRLRSNGYVHLPFHLYS